MRIIGIGQLVEIEDRLSLSFENDCAAEPQHPFGHDAIGGGRLRVNTRDQGETCEGG